MKQTKNATHCLPDEWHSTSLRSLPSVGKNSPRSTFSLLSSSNTWRRRILAPKTNWRCQSFWRIVRPVSSSVGCGQAACPAANNRSWPNRELLEARYLLCPPQRGSSQHKQLVVRKICENLKAQRQAINSFGLTHKMSLCNLTPNHTKVSDDKGHRGPLKRQMIRVRGDKSAGHLFSPDRLVHRLLLWQLPFSELEELWSWLGGKGIETLRLGAIECVGLSPPAWEWYGRKWEAG